MNFIWDNFFLVCVVLYCIGALLWPFISPGARISHSKATQLINKGKVAIIDIQSPADFKTGHLFNAVNVPEDKLEGQLHRLEKMKQQPVLLVCKNGKRVRAAAKILRGADFGEVYTLNGGVEAWKKEGLPVTM